MSGLVGMLPKLVIGGLAVLGLNAAARGAEAVEGTAQEAARLAPWVAGGLAVYLLTRGR